MTKFERNMMMLNVIHEENKALADIVVNIAFDKDTAEELVSKIRNEWDSKWKLAVFGEYDENGKLVYEQ